MSVCIDEAGEDVDRFPDWRAVGERDEDHLVSVERPAIPRAVLAHEAPEANVAPRLAPSANVSPSGATWLPSA
jgi:hypothetical protein